MLGEFLTWWGGQLLELVPLGFGARRGRHDALIAEWPAGPAGAALLMAQRQRMQETPIGPFACDATGMASLRARLDQPPTHIRLRVAAALLLERLVVLPAAAERNWRNVLRFEMGRLTPFTADQVFWDGAVARRDPARGKVTLNLWLIPKAKLAPAIDVLTAAGLAPSAIEVADEAGATKIIDLRETVGAARRDALVWALGGVCAVLAVVAVVLPFVLQTLRADAVAGDIARLRPVVARVAALRHDQLAGAASQGVIAATRSQVGDPLTVLAVVTDALPDNSFLTELTLNHLQLNIAGQAAAAAPLLAALSGNDLLTNVAFSAPVTHDTGKQQDLFAIQSHVAPP